MQTNKYLQKVNTRQIIGIIFLLLSFSFGVALCSMVELIHIDDVMYAEWTQNDFSYFVKQNFWHYNNYNGRAFIHLCLQIMLIFKEALFPLIVPLFLSAGFYLFFKTTAPNLSVTKKLFATSISLMFVWSLGARYLESTVLWMAGTFNYIFPFLIVAIGYALFLKNKDNAKTSVITIILLFLSGATTEQYGMITIGLITLTLLFDFIDKKIKWVNALRYLLPSILGCASVVLAPGTFNRIFKMNDVISTNNLTFIDKFYGNCEMLFGSYGNVFITVALFLIIGIVAINKKSQYSKLCISGIIVGILVTILHFTVFENLKFVLCVVELLFLCFALCKKKETREQGKLLICAVGSFVMMSATLNYNTRTCMPFILLVITLSVLILKDISLTKKNILSYTCFTLIFIVCLSNFITTFKATRIANDFCSNMESQLLQAKNTKEVVIDLDETLAGSTYKHRITTLFEVYNLNELERYRKLFDIPEDTKFSFISERYNTSSIMLDDEYCLLPMITIENKQYIPIKTVYLLDVELMNIDGKKFVYNNSIFEFNNNTIYKKDNNNVLVQKEIETTEIKQFAGATPYLELESFCKWLNLGYTYNEAENTYHLNKLD